MDIKTGFLVWYKILSMSSKRKVVKMESVSKVCERALTKQLRLQEARREFYYFMQKNPEISDENSADSEEYFRHYNELEQARADSRQAIEDLNEVLCVEEGLLENHWDGADAAGEEDSSSQGGTGSAGGSM